MMGLQRGKAAFLCAQDGIDSKIVIAISYKELSIDDRQCGMSTNLRKIKERMHHATPCLLIRK